MSKESIFAFGRFLPFSDVVSTHFIVELTASFPSAYMSSSDLWMDLLNLQTCHSFAPVMENMYYILFFFFSQASQISINFRAILRILRKHRPILNLTDAKNTSVCSTAERHKKLHVSRKCRRETPPSPVRIRWKVIRLNLAPIFRLIPAVLWWGLLWRFFFPEQVL